MFSHVMQRMILFHAIDRSITHSSVSSLVLLAVACGVSPLLVEGAGVGAAGMAMTTGSMIMTGGSVTVTGSCITC